MCYYKIMVTSNWNNVLYVCQNNTQMIIRVIAAGMQTIINIISILCFHSHLYKWFRKTYSAPLHVTCINHIY